jgi:polysaccharide pyruvyl transferase WcaK-like protein
MSFLAPRLAHFHKNASPVDAVGVGVDDLESTEAKELFREYFLPIRSWTVRSPFCRAALLRLGVAEERIRVGADWAWLYSVKQNLVGWAEAFWRRCGVDPRRSLLVINPVNLIWRDQVATKANIATALDKIVRSLGMQIAFFCNECRDGADYDYVAALEIQQAMREPAIIVPNEYYSPDEAITLLMSATVTVAQRYHFAIQSVLAGGIPVSIVRGQKMEGLVRELGLPTAGTIESVDSDLFVNAVACAVRDRATLIPRLQTERHRMNERAKRNLDMIKSVAPYAQLFSS